MHAPLKRMVPGARCGVIFIHGIVSTPRFFDDFVACVPEDWSVHNLLLPGHGGSVREFGRHAAREWVAHVRDALDEMRQSHERVYIVAHSLGTLLAIREAVRNSDRLAGMLLLCVPLRIWARPSALAHNALLGVGLAGNGPELHRFYGVEQDARFWRYAGWLPRYVELFVQSAAARKEIARLTVPSRVFMAEQDELVSLRGEKLMTGHPAITLARLPESRHHQFAPADKAALLDALRAMCAES